mmetsp:Transcript_95445/g.309284  ORF Transcript_95445/g.309284 Transcript_95445/m.309284 type:complete len:508 (-) Transcript_95445:117-1640(-)
MADMSAAWKELDKPAVKEVRVRGTEYKGKLDPRLWKLESLRELELTRFSEAAPTRVGGDDSDASKEVGPEGTALFDCTFQSLFSSSFRLAPLCYTLQHLDLSSNAITEFPVSDVFQNCGKTLTYLNMDDNRLSYLPASILCCERLTVLTISRNCLFWLPDVLLEACEKLELLKCDGNELVALPRFPSDCKLKTLSCASNKLSELLALAETLTSIDVSSNALEEFTFSGDKLKDLNLQGNPLTDKKLLKLVDEGASKGLKAILAHLRGGMSKRQQKKKAAAADSDDESSALPANMLKDLLTVHMEKAFQQARPYWVGVLVHGVDFGKVSLESFLQLQLKLQGNRTQIGIGSHDVAPADGIQFPLRLTTKDCAANPEVSFHPLFEEGPRPLSFWLRERWPQDQSRCNYAKMVDETRVAVLENRDERLISVYPVSNCGWTATRPDTRSCLIEVSGVASLERCDCALRDLLQFLHQGQGEGLQFQRIQVVDHKGRGSEVVLPHLDFFEELL